MGKLLNKENNFKNNLALINKLSKEKINKEKFGEHFNEGEDYLSIIRVWGAALNCWKKNNFKENFKERLIFNYRKIKANKRISEKLNYQIKNNQVVFFPISETQTMIVEPILKNTKDSYILRFDHALNGLKNEFEKRKLPYINIEYFLNSEIKNRIKNKRKSFNWVLQAHKSIAKQKKDYITLSVFFNYYFGNRNRFYEIIEFMETFKEFLIQKKPSLIFLADDGNDIPRAVSYLCEKNKIPCIVCQHGNFDSNSIIIGETFATKKLVFGDSFKEILINKGTNKKDIEVVGSPIYDDIKKISKKDKLKFKKNLGIQDDRKIILLDSARGDTEEFKEKLNHIIKTIKNSNFKLIIKQHPCEYRDDKYKNIYNKIANEHNVPIIISQDKMSDMLNISDVFITRFSTTMIEALALDIPVILLNTKRESIYENFPESKRVLEQITNLNKFEEKLKSILESKDTKPIIKNRKRILENNAGKIDGKTTERIVKMINKLKLK